MLHGRWFLSGKSTWHRFRRSHLRTGHIRHALHCGKSEKVSEQNVTWKNASRQQEWGKNDCLSFSRSHKSTRVWPTTKLLLTPLCEPTSIWTCSPAWQSHLLTKATTASASLTFGVFPRYLGARGIPRTQKNEIDFSKSFVRSDGDDRKHEPWQCQPSCSRDRRPRGDANALQRPIMTFENQTNAKCRVGNYVNFPSRCHGFAARRITIDTCSHFLG